MADLRPTQAARLLQAKDDRKAAGPSNSVARALSILGLLNNSPHPLSFSDIKEKLELPKSTTSLLLSTLESLGYLTRDADDRRYWVSPQVYSPKAVPMNHQELTANAMPVLKEISSATRLTSFISVLEVDQVLFLAKADGSSQTPCDVYPGRRASAQCTAVGKVLLAWLDQDERSSFLARHKAIPHTNRTITSKHALRDELDSVHKLGYAVDDREESLSIRCLAVPVGGGSVALGLTGSLREIRPDNISSLVAYLRRMAPQIDSPLRAGFGPSAHRMVTQSLQ
ncbi:MAG: hypothetical protein JWN34_3940 [Bryobacterales bacterium]|nr:hypothetical protein [Bryobacterales bacterium]